MSSNKITIRKLTKKLIKTNNAHNANNDHNVKRKGMRGGKYLGQGSYGCVITPALKCNKFSLFGNSSKSSKNNKHNTKISKIVLAENKGIREEININYKLKKIDPAMAYFITIDEYCKIKDIPKDRSNIITVKYKHKEQNNSYNSDYDAYNNNTSDTHHIRYDKSKYVTLQKKKLDKKYCPVDLHTNPINIIMPYGGYDLYDIMNSIRDYKFKPTNTLHPSLLQKTSTNNTILIQQYIVHMLYTNLKHYLKHLLYGIYKMHKNRIVNRDIKPENIMAKYNKESNNINIRFIDFGLSEELTNEYCTHYSNILANGTRDYIPLDICIIYNIIYHDDSLNDDDIKKNIDNDMKDQLSLFKDLNINTSNYKDMRHKLYNEYKTLYNNNEKQKILNKYFGITHILDGNIQKQDIFGLGVTIYTFISVYNNKTNRKKNIQLFDLLHHMIDNDPDKRYNVIKCLNHPYLQK